jgi:rSAM/selenodomain-associated transferase 2
LRPLLCARRRKLLGLGSISVIIPALNAAPTLARTIASAAGAGEIIVVDGGSEDETAAVARAAGAKLVKAQRGRGTQLRAGAEAANGEWLLFLHADTRLSRNWTVAVTSHMARSRGAACFRFRLDSESWQARLVERGVALRVKLFGLPYGDQGLFLSRSLYEEAGGYRPLPLMEDVDLVHRLGPVRLLAAEAVTSAEKWRRDGWFRRSARNLACLALYKAGRSPEQIARFYS